MSESNTNGTANIPVFDPEFQFLLPPLSDEERAILEHSIQVEGQRDPIVVWDEENIIVDGHNRAEILDSIAAQPGHDPAKHTPHYKRVSFSDRDAAKRWICLNARGRRNITPETRAYLAGVSYLSMKNPGGKGTKKRTRGNNCHQFKAEELANELGVSARTIRNAAEYAEAVNEIDRKLNDDHDTKNAILFGEYKLNMKDVPVLAKASAKQLSEAFQTGEKAIRQLIDHIREKAERTSKVTKEPADKATPKSSPSPPTKKVNAAPDPPDTDQDQEDEEEMPETFEEADSDDEAMEEPETQGEPQKMGFKGGLEYALYDLYVNQWPAGDYLTFVQTLHEVADVIEKAEGLIPSTVPEEGAA